MLNLPFIIARSRPISGAELVDAADQIRARWKHDDFTAFGDAELHTYDFRVYSLPEINAFRKIFNVTLVSVARDTASLDAFVEMTRSTYATSNSHSWTTWYVAESACANNTCEKHDLNIFAGLRKEGFFCGVDLFRPSPAADDLYKRAALFKNVLTSLGLNDNIKISFDSDVLRMTAESPWTLVFPAAQIGGGNPSGFFAVGYTNVDDPISAGQCLVQQFAKKVIGVSFVTKLPGDAYDAVYRELNSLSTCWDVSVMGELSADSVAILKGGDISSDSPSPIPAFRWTGDNHWAAYGSVVIENQNRYLEIATFGGTREQLEERTALLADFDFRLV